jgi:H+/Cl- antiporter ClcA
LAAAGAAYVIAMLIGRLVGPLPFIPMPNSQEIMFQVTLIMLSLGLLLGVVGSKMGIHSSREKSQ